VNTKNNISHPDHGTTTSVDAVEFYDDLWANTTRIDQHHKCRILAIERVLAKLLKNSKGTPTILELGSGSGIVAAVLSKYGSITGVDQSSVGVDISRNNVAGGTFVVGTLPDIPVNRKDFDVCVMTQVIEHLSESAQYEVLQNSLAKVKPGGMIIVTTPNKPVSNAMRFARGELQPLENWFAATEIENLLKKSGWRVLETSFAFSFFPITASRSIVFRGLRYLSYDLLFLRRPIEWAMSRFPRGDTIVTVAQRAVK
jgi:2-polyprenyl-3-methyl-5-hydroxy-6-metoxy-1,4-benzoquinol methylase